MKGVNFPVLVMSIIVLRQENTDPCYRKFLYVLDQVKVNFIHFIRSLEKAMWTSPDVNNS